MKKSNIILIAIAVLLSAFLLWLWYYLGFNHVDNPLDLVLSIIWWVIVVILIAGIVQVEKTRREKVRTMYVGPGFVFNSEAGTVALDGAQALEVLEKTVADLKYDFTSEQIADENKEAVKKIVRTKEYKAPQNEDEEPTWKGEVCIAFSDEDPKEFASKEELAALL